jgi:hypothetical protein
VGILDANFASPTFGEMVREFRIDPKVMPDSAIFVWWPESKAIMAHSSTNSRLEPVREVILDAGTGSTLGHGESPSRGQPWSYVSLTTGATGKFEDLFGFPLTTGATGKFEDLFGFQHPVRQPKEGPFTYRAQQNGPHDRDLILRLLCDLNNR